MFGDLFRRLDAECRRFQALRRKAVSEPLGVIPESVRPVLEQAALEYASMSPSEFESDVLYVGSTRLRELGLIDSDVWAKVPAHDNIKVSRQADGTLNAIALLAGL